MKRYIALLRFTDSGAQALAKSTERAAAWAKAAAKAGVEVEGQYWSVGEYDGVLILGGADEKTVLGQLAKLAKSGNVRTQTMKLFDADQFDAIVKG